ncbi:hypothetical protein I6F38_28175 [Bradyrhizobium sp. BRP56]|nr:hypothetical protein [Bradyrhizobium sp. BRP56]
MRNPLQLLAASPDVAGLHPVIGPWHRQGPWIRGKHRASYEACYRRSDPVEYRYPIVDRKVIQDEAAVSWIIDNTPGAFSRTTRAPRSHYDGLEAEHGGVNADQALAMDVSALISRGQEEKR